MINIAICDDNAEFRILFEKELQKQMTEYFPKTIRYCILDGFSGSMQVLEYMKTNPIDILFLDIVMPEMNGLELAKKLAYMRSNTIIILVSGYDQFVYEVFEFSPFAFLRKDHLSEELPKTILRIAERFEKENTDVDLITVSNVFTVCSRDILYVHSKGNYYTCHEKSGKQYVCRGTLSEAEKQFGKFDFFRVHSAYLVNLYHIQKINKNELFVGIGETRIPIAQRRLAVFRKIYTEFTMKYYHL